MTPAVQPELIQPGITERSKKRCKYCHRKPNRAGGLCHRHHAMWLKGQPGILPDPPRRRTRHKPTCAECPEPATAKGLCPKHYSRMRRSLNRPRCTLPYCDQPRPAGNRLYCAVHSTCIADGCNERFMARRLCAKHYRTHYLAPRDRAYLLNLTQQDTAQPPLFDELQQTPGDAPHVPDHQPFLMFSGAPPLHAQAGCEPSATKDIQECADAINLLHRMGIIPQATVNQAQARASRMLSNRLTKRNRQKEKAA